MGEFRIGRKFAQHSYPESRQNTTVPYASNFAEGPANSTTAVTTDGTQVPWQVVAAGSPGVDVPVTPSSTGALLFSGVISLKNIAGEDTEVRVRLQTSSVDLPIPADERIIVPANGRAVIPILSLVSALVGATHNFQVQVTALGSEDDDIFLVGQSCTLEILEVPLPTG